MTSDKTIVGWAAALRDIDRHKLADEYETDIKKDFQLVAQLGLPTYDSFLVSASEFLTGFQSFERTFRYEKYYLVLLPVKAAFRKFSLVDFGSLKDAKDFVVRSIAGSYDRYFLKISEFETNVYGISIISNDGVVIVEMTRGLQIGIAYGTVNVCSARLDKTSASVKYSTEDCNERLLMWNAIAAIMKGPSEDCEVHEVRGYWFLKGYFECAYTQKEGRDGLRLVFIDLKLGVAYRNISNR